jgi:hypothetical protein
MLNKELESNILNYRQVARSQSDLIQNKHACLQEKGSNNREAIEMVFSIWSDLRLGSKAT